MQQSNLYFFGAGKIGRQWISICSRSGIQINGIIDNDEARWGTLCENIKIYSIDVLAEDPKAKVAITCARSTEMEKQLLEYGIDKERIVLREDLFFYFFQELAENRVYPGFPEISVEKRQTGKKLLLALDNGMVLGGVEAWIYQMAKLWKKQGWDGLYLVGRSMITVADDTFPHCILEYSEQSDEKECVDVCIMEITKHLPCTIICNFASTIFEAACIVKAYAPEPIRVIAVQHNDEKVYYKKYTQWQQCVDDCLVISSKMAQEIVRNGMNPAKLKNLTWKIACENALNRSWHTEDEPLQIGYAGRITRVQKRADLFIPIAKGLSDSAIRFQLNICGDGDYMEELREEIRQQNLQDVIKLHGLIDRSRIPKFWEKQDIMMSCSDWEGHSLTQCEAMAAGALPVITDVSGARDDVEDGTDGFVVPVGDWETIVEKIMYLNVHRNLLQTMGERAHQKILKNNEKADQEKFWKELLEGK